MVALSFFVSFLVFGQKELEKYIPYAESSWDTHPEIEIRTIIHIIKKSESDAANLTEDSTSYLNQQYDWINSYYRDLRKPTLLTSDGVEHYIPSARVKFKLEKVLYHTDENDWDRIRVAADTRNPMKFINYNEELNEIEVAGNWKSSLFRSEDSLKVLFEDGSFINTPYTAVDVKSGNTIFRLKAMPTFTRKPLSVLVYKEENKNCSLELWQKYADDKNALHVFYTGSSKSGIAFGCGPRPYFLNVSNIIKGGDWAGAQLTAHELGHTIGLSHTDRPQFDDLPKKDKFGFIDCNSSLTSNNIMGYNICRNYLSPLQVAHVHALYSKDSSRITLTTANEYNPYETIEIWSDTTWNKAMVVKKDIIIRRGQTLEIKDQLHMAAGASIYIEAKAKLIVDGAIITNYFDSGWSGVKLCRRYERKNKMPCKEKNIGVVNRVNSGKIMKESNP